MRTLAVFLLCCGSAFAFEPVETKLVKSSDKPIPLKVDVTGVVDLYLIATYGGDSYDYDRAVWGEPTLFDADGKAVRLTSLTPVEAKVGWGTLLTDKNHQDQPLSITGEAMQFGYWAHAPSMLHFKLDGKYARFETKVGLDTGSEYGTVVFHVCDVALPYPAIEEYMQNYSAAADSTAHISYAVSDAEQPNSAAIRRAINDLIETFGSEYLQGSKYLEELDKLDEKKAPLDEYEQLRRQALLFDNPYIDFDQLIFIRRHQKGPGRAFPANFDSNSSLPRGGYDDEIMLLSIKNPAETPTSFYKPPRDTAITDLDLHFDAGRLMFSAIGENNRWHLFEIGVPFPAKPRQLTKNEPDVDCYDSCYMPDGNIMLTSTASMIGVPCVYGSSHVANLFVFNPATEALRQVGFDQDHSWCPTMLNDGRVLYTRWEYADIPHSNSRLLFSCNPDGASQLEYYGSNSYWPTSVFFAKPLPDHPTQVVAVIGGHHDNGRLGELILFDRAVSCREAEGAVQRIPGWGKKVEGPVADGLTRNSWPKFVHPYPISQKHFLVAAIPKPGALLGLYLVDTFDNMILIKEMPQNAMVEPIPLRKTPKPPVIPSKIDLARDDATVFVSNVLEGPGLQGIPQGVVKNLRIYTYHYAYHNIGGLLGIVGQDGPWDVRGVLGTVPVESDGSAYFRTPANLPISVLPLDEHGQALQLMRSWMTPMPGENLQCNGCHESQNSVPPPINRLPIALSCRSRPPKSTRTIGRISTLPICWAT